MPKANRSKKIGQLWPPWASAKSNAGDQRRRPTARRNSPPKAWVR